MAELSARGAIFSAAAGGVEDLAPLRSRPHFFFCALLKYIPPKTLPVSELSTLSATFSECLYCFVQLLHYITITKTTAMPVQDVLSRKDGVIVGKDVYNLCNFDPRGPG